MAGYFGVPYQVFFEDTMAYGTHHYLTNFRFQCVGRETLLFDVLPETDANTRAQLDELILLTREGYTRNLAPVRLGEKVGILMTAEDRSRSTVRLCFRVMREDGQPVCCGYQTIVFVDKVSYEPAPIPPALARFMDTHAELTEQLTAPSFAERCHIGGKHVKEIFAEPRRTLGSRVAKQRGPANIVTTDDIVEESVNNEPLAPMPVAFVFPGQGSYDASLLRELYQSHSEKVPYFTYADRAARDAWGHRFLPLIDATTAEAHDAHLRQCPELDQIGIFLGGVIVGQLLIEQGIRPDVLVGHSFGELAALCVGGAYDVPTGIDIVIARVNALRDANYGRGAMLAISVTPERARELLSAIGGAQLDIAGVNHAKQVVVSGARDDIERLAAELPKHGAMGTPLRSRHPFHSRMLNDAATLFEKALRGRRYAPLSTRVFSPILGGLYPTDVAVPRVLASHFITPFDFHAAVDKLREAGVETFVECGAGETLTKIVRKNAPDAPAGFGRATAPQGARAADGIRQIAQELGVVTAAGPAAPETAASRKEPNESRGAADCVPVAIVGMGCVVPDARSVDELWRNVNEGVSGIAELTVLDPTMAEDFQVPGDVVPDKAYSLLAGVVRSIEADPRSPYSPEEFAALTRAQRLLANALTQCVKDGLSIDGSARTHCLLGSTADGIKEYDEALAMHLARHSLAKLDEPTPVKARFARALDGIVEMDPGDPDMLAPHPSCAAVVERVLGRSMPTILFDSACASSLYAVDAALKMLGAGETDLVLAGGVFAPGPGINVLFGQFKGLSSTGCFPFDARADGVVFGEGAAVLALKRLSDAIAAGDRIHGVIRGVGLASDGKSASVNVPRSEGQVLAMRRAYEKTGIDPNTVQYLEAHATSTTVGDATEFESLRTAFGDRRRELPPIWLESVKSLTGHTGWVAGATSIIKVTRALEEKRVPPQHNFVTEHPAFHLEASPFVVPRQPMAWNANIDGEPRRAGINGFGFGGTNAHLLLEEYESAYHRRLTATLRRSPAAPQSLVIVSAATLFPAADGGVAGMPNGAAAFDRRSLRLPGKKRLLPDVTEHMDVGQYLAAIAAERALSRIPNWELFRDRIGMVLGATAKTPQGVAATSRVFIDRLRRAIGLRRAETELTEAQFTRLRDELLGELARHGQPSNPYTLIGFMPNVATGRVANLFDLKGANVVVDGGPRSLLVAVDSARRMLAAGDCDVVLAGAVQVAPAAHRSADVEPLPDGICVLGLTTPAIAAARGLPVLSEIAVDQNELRFTTSNTTSSNGSAAMASSVVKVDSREGAASVPGLVEVARALDDASRGTSAVVTFAATTTRERRTSRRSTATVHRTTLARRRSSLTTRLSGALDAATIEAALTAADEPVGFFTPGRFSVPSPNERAPLPRAPLFVVDQPNVLASLRRSRVLEGGRAIVAVPMSLDAPDAYHVDLSSDETIGASLAALDCSRFDALIALKDLGGAGGDALLDAAESDDRLLDLFFAVARHAYPYLRRSVMSVATVCLNGFAGTEVQPYSGLLAGFVKSLARELPTTRSKSLIIDDADLTAALDKVAVELAGSSSPVEVCYEGDTRQIFRLVPVPVVTTSNRPYIDRSSVVLATGGGRGVTALLVEELLERFGCTVVLLGRTDPSAVPDHILAMDAAQFRAHEPEFYRETLSRDRTVKPAAMKKLYQSYAAARETTDVLRRLTALPGRVEYVSADVSSANDMDRVVHHVVRQYGRLDLVMHGAGVQTSTRLDNRKLSDWRRTIETKIGGLRNLYTATRAHVANDVHFHILTSAFSYFGNDGQPDYGAANEAMNRIAQYMSTAGTGAHWTSLAWLAWDGVGMTRGSEYATLVAERGLHGVTADEGRSLFATLMRGRPAAAANILMSNAERRLLDVDVADRKSASVLTPGPTTSDGPSWQLDLGSAPYLREHVVNGTPTVPGTFELALAVEAAQATRPGRVFSGAHNLLLSRFIKVAEEQRLHLRSVAQIVSETSRATVVRVALLSDFVHKSGAVLQRDVVHFETEVRLTNVAEPLQGPVRLPAAFAGRSATDPYMDPRAPVRLGGAFACLHDIVIGTERRRARFRLTHPAHLPILGAFPIPPVLLDAMMRLTVVEADGPGSAPVFVPERIERVRTIPGLSEAQLFAWPREITIVAAHPELDGEMLTARWVQAVDDTGRTLALVEFGTGRRMERQQLRDVTARPSRRVSMATPVIG